MQDHIRNFAIIAHIDHGKSTLADRLLELTGTVPKREMRDQILDSNPIERERGITIKLAPVRMMYTSSSFRSARGDIRDGVGDSYLVSGEEKDKTQRRDTSTYILNLIDTPGHVDFGYEVSRSLAACEGAILVVDATQGVQAQTLANLHQAREHKLTIIPVINKIDMPNARIDDALRELSSLGFSDEEIIEISAKTGQNVEKVLDAIVRLIPPPNGVPDAPLRALVFSSQYDAHKGVVVFVRVVDGLIHNDKLKFIASGAQLSPIEIGFFAPQMHKSEEISTGEVGYIATGLKDVRFAKVGDTITIGEANESLPGYKEPKPMVFLSLFPIKSDEFTTARECLEKLRLSDSAFTFRPISSLALGNGFHCGFLGLLHAEIVQERLSREFNLNMIATAPSVEYHLTLKSGVNPSKLGFSASSYATDYSLPTTRYFSIQSASEFPDPTIIDSVKEPVMTVTIYTPKKYVGAVMQLSEEKRGEYVDLVYHGNQAEFTYSMPLSEMIVDFFDRLKSVSEGYASLDYEFFEYQAVDVVKVDILVNHEKVDALSFLAIENQARRRALAIVERLAQVIPRQQFSIPIQGAIGGEIIARADVKPFRKDVIAKLYGGDRTRKDKLLEAQKRGKERMKLVGKVQIPQEAFFQVLKRE